MESLDALEKSLDDLEEVLAPLLDKSLPETLDQLELMQKAKLQVLLPYVVNDLVFIYLKARGINPKTHPVVGELDRVKQYFDKIKKAEDPEKRRFAVDQGAATRFIKHAIKESQALQEQAQQELKQGTHTRFTETGAMAGPSSRTVVLPSVTGSEAALAKIQAREIARQEEESSSEENELEVFAEPAPRTPAGEELSNGKGKHKEKELQATSGTKRRRGMDPWTGYDENRDASKSIDVSTEKQRRKKAKKQSRSSTPQEKEGTTQNTAATVSQSKKRTDIAPQVIDVDAHSPKISDDQDPTRSQLAQAIDADTVNSSQSGTPAQEKTKKRKNRKKSIP